MHGKQEKAPSFHGYIQIKISYIHIKCVIWIDDINVKYANDYSTCKSK